MYMNDIKQTETILVYLEIYIYARAHTHTEFVQLYKVVVS